MSKVFEYCLLDRFKDYLEMLTISSALKNVGCSFVIRTVRNIVDCYDRGGSTANLCAIDLA